MENLAGWLTTVVARVCLDMLRSRKSRREEPLPPQQAGGVDPEHEAALADSVGLAMLVVLETLEPAERVAFVLRDMFGVPFDEIAPIVGRTPTAARQLASRGRRRVQGRSTVSDRSRHREVVEAFLTASRQGDFEALMALLDPDVVVRADATSIEIGAPGEVRGAGEVARIFVGRARAAVLASVDGVPGWIWLQHGQVRMVFSFTVAGEKITGIDMIAGADRLGQIAIARLTVA